MGEYEGFSNFETWTTFVWFANDEKVLYKMNRYYKRVLGTKKIQLAKQATSNWKVEEATKSGLSDFLQREMYIMHNKLIKEDVGLLNDLLKTLFLVLIGKK